MVLIGHDNYLNSDLIAVILTPEGSPAKRLRKNADEKGYLVNATAGNKTRSVVILTTNQVILSALQPSTLKERVEKVKYFAKRGHSG